MVWEPLSWGIQALDPTISSKTISPSSPSLSVQPQSVLAISVSQPPSIPFYVCISTTNSVNPYTGSQTPPSLIYHSHQVPNSGSLPSSLQTILPPTSGEKWEGFRNVLSSIPIHYPQKHIPIWTPSLCSFPSVSEIRFSSSTSRPTAFPPFTFEMAHSLMPWGTYLHQLSIPPYPNLECSFHYWIIILSPQILSAVFKTTSPSSYSLSFSFYTHLSKVFYICYYFYFHTFLSLLNPPQSTFCSQRPRKTVLKKNTNDFTDKHILILLIPNIYHI